MIQARQYSKPQREQFTCDEDYYDALDAWDFEQVLRAAYLESKKIVTH